MGWGPEGVVLGDRDGVAVVPASGNGRRPLIEASDEWRAITSVVFLPGGDLLFLATTSADEVRLYVHAAGVSTLLRTLPVTGSFPRIFYAGGNWLALDSGSRGGDRGLWAVPFDAAARRSEGDPISVIPGAGSPTVSQEGALLYADYEIFQSEYELVWVNRSGEVQGIVRASSDKRPGGTPVISPDGERVAVLVVDPDVADSEELLVYEFAAPGAPVRLYAGADLESIAGWFPDSQHVVVSLTTDSGDLRIVGLPLAGGDQPLDIAVARAVRTPRRGIAAGSRPQVSPGGERLSYIDAAGAAQEIAISPAGALSDPQPISTGGLVEEVNPVLSPDGRLAALRSSAGSASSLTLTRLPGGLSTFPLGDNARSPRWAAGGRELFFHQQVSATESAVMLVGIDPEAGRPTGAPSALFSTTVGPGQFLLSSFDVAPDGQRFLMTLLRQPPTRHVLIEDFDAWVDARIR